MIPDDLLVTLLYVRLLCLLMAFLVALLVILIVFLVMVQNILPIMLFICFVTHLNIFMVCILRQSSASQCTHIIKFIDKHHHTIKWHFEQFYLLEAFLGLSVELWGDASSWAWFRKDKNWGNPKNPEDLKRFLKTISKIH